jgi:8-amino-3,8-dideoxy-alpha-D-manno-octulosonate transaminase
MRTIEKLPMPEYGSAWLGDEELALLHQVIERKQPNRYYGAGPYLADQFEQQLAEKFGVKCALATTSGTAAEETALAALGVGPGDEVIIPAWSWISCFTSVVRLGARPVLAEMDESLCLDPSEIDRLVTEKTRAVLVIHFQGAAANMDAIFEAAKRHNLAVLEDCAQSAGATYNGRPVGSLGDIAIYSFQVNKVLTSGEGGALVTSSDKLYERAVRAHDLGLYRPYHESVAAPTQEPFTGGQCRVNEVTAALMLGQFGKLDKIVSHCRKLSSHIRGVLSQRRDIRLRPLADAEGEIGIETYFWTPDADSYQAIQTGLEKRGVYAQPRTGTYSQYRRPYCLNRSTHSGIAAPFAEYSQWPAAGYRPEDFPRTEGLVRNLISLPVGCNYSEDDAKWIAEQIDATLDEVGVC